MAFDIYESPAFARLFRAYTGAPQSVGIQLTLAAERAHAAAPLIVATSSDLALYPGHGAPPAVEGFRLSTRGFKELTAVSHLGPAVASLARIKELDPGGPWPAAGAELLAATRETREANTAELWRDLVRIDSFAGREPEIAAMIDYACVVTERILERSLRDESYLTAEAVRRDYLDGPSDDLPVPLNRIMVATFYLFGMDLGHRLINWFDGLGLPWEETMVIIAGRQGRPTAGVTRDSNSVAGVINAASRGRLPERNLLIAPHAPVFPMYDGTNLDAVSAQEPAYRRLWSGVRATCELGEQMFAGYPRFQPSRSSRRTVRPGTETVSEMPAINGPADWFALTARLRLVLEDPRQLLSGAVTDFAAQQLVDNGNDPARIFVPGLDGEPYPVRASSSAHDRIHSRGYQGEAS
ncbi:DUF5624 domain-containing protein [Streptomyces sp. SID13031]|uniref:DUF5624 domain-containing protein n=1 Tax=Streptomyces sp. SID13031 TaxID=2706046 RepID=UPI0013C97E0B|nr:DUF5624 domain-containing protein [Streptomyces sp. SID13031]NEA32856.1 hypothetical protein [Streptomyces sp. SID13031]